ncbi:Aste57867_19766 [Aphanomyces stellatus]|uniref:Aste57867_19766 protein n=1 Tax=Aphanomyces stellatus TaxID=120398 RepID=A0A485LD74_9STRA|nr:hypothetical protein As57867_019701 [Aphanomyces stellatus]VFT96464.1 Aste57867_19766 [Aphanomyces stellatus]
MRVLAGLATAAAAASFGATSAGASTVLTVCPMAEAESCLENTTDGTVITKLNSSSTAFNLSGLNITVVHAFPPNAKTISHYFRRDLSYNNICALPWGGASIQKLNMSHNSLDPMWSQVSLPANVAVLDLSYNANLRFDPNQFRSLVKLTDLHFRANKVATVSLVGNKLPATLRLLNLLDNPNLVLFLDTDMLAFLSRPSMTVQATTDLRLTQINCNGGLVTTMGSPGVYICLVGLSVISSTKSNTGVVAGMLPLLVVADLPTDSSMFHVLLIFGSVCSFIGVAFWSTVIYDACKRHRAHLNSPRDTIMSSCYVDEGLAVQYRISLSPSHRPHSPLPGVI